MQVGVDSHQVKVGVASHQQEVDSHGVKVEIVEQVTQLKSRFSPSTEAALKLDPLVCAIWQAQWHLTKGGMFSNAPLDNMIYENQIVPVLEARTTVASDRSRSSSKLSPN